MIAKIRGDFHGMNTERVFRVVVVAPDQGASLEPAVKTTDVRYDGRKVSLRF